MVGINGGRMMAYIPERFQEQVAVVVGGAQGIGRAVALRLGLEGAVLVIADIDRKMMSRAEKEIRRAKAEVRTVYCDVRRRASVERMVARVIRWHARIDVLMYIAGVGKGVPFLRTDEK